METQPTSGFPLWVWEVEPGSMHDIAAGRPPAPHRAAAIGLPALADPGYDGSGIGITSRSKSQPGTRTPT